MNAVVTVAHHTFHLNSEFVKALAESGIRVIVIGGLAVKHYCPEREADDLDLLVEPTVTAGRNISDALNRFNDAPTFSADAFARPQQHYPQKRALYLDLVTPHADDNFDDLWRLTSAATLNGIPVRIVGLSDLLVMKHRAIVERDEIKDRQDVALLQTVTV